MSEPAKKKQKTSHTAIIAEPLADKKLTKRILKLNKKASKEKGLRRGVKEVSFSPSPPHRLAPFRAWLDPFDFNHVDRY